MINLNKDNIWKNIEVNKNDRLMEKYRRKKINKLGCFNLINGKAKSGNNIFAKNINRLNIVNNKYLMKYHHRQKTSVMVQNGYWLINL